MSAQPINEPVDQNMGSNLPFDATLRTIYQLVPKHLAHPRVGIVCGSGLSTLAESLRDVVLVPYEKLEGFGKSTGGLFTLMEPEDRM